MATNLQDYVRSYDNLVDSDLCKRILEAFGKSNSEYIDREQRPSFTELNLTNRLKAKDPLWSDIHIKLEDYFVDAVSLYMDELELGPDFPAKYCFEELRLKYYQNNGHDQFKDHVDVQDYNSARRFLVCFLYLNDVGEGGQTYFPKLDVTVEPRCGRILLFPPTWMYRHAGLPPQSNKKYIVGTYLHYL
tara:strand:- start:3696 stop:4262 length:567 start_codon:yes stop_codon:yes gene_type:complete